MAKIKKRMKSGPPYKQGEVHGVYNPNKNFNNTRMMSEVVSETVGMPKYKMKSKVKLKTGNTETPSVGQKVIDGVTYNVNAEGTPVSSVVPRGTAGQKKTPWESYLSRVKPGGYQAFKTEEEYERNRQAFNKKHSKGGAHYKGDGHGH